MKVERDSKVTIIHLSADYDVLDPAAQQEFTNTLVGQAEQADPPLLVVDLSEADYINSTMLEGLLRAWKRINQRKGKMALCGVQSFCREVLQVTRLDSLWELFPNKREAVAKLTAGENL